MTWQSVIYFKELAHNGLANSGHVRRVPLLFDAAIGGLCAFKELAHNGLAVAARVSDTELAARRALCASKGLPLLIAVMLCGQLLAGTVTGSTRLIQSSESGHKKRNDLSGVVVWLTSTEHPPTRVPAKHSRMLQKDKKFSPHILAIQTGTSVDFPNLDPIFHNAFSNYEGQIFDVALYPPGSSRTVRFDKPGIVRVFCNIHASMSAIIVVVDSNGFTTTDRDGHYAIPNVSPGKYQVHFFSERATPETLAKLTQNIVVGEDTEPLALVSISETGYLPVAHKNKYGRDYPADDDRRETYSPQMR